MSIVDRRRRERYLALKAEAEAAKEYFEDYVNFPAVQIQIADRSDDLKNSAAKNALVNGTPDRLDLIVALLDLRASAYLTLVGSMKDHKAYIVLLGDFGRQAIEGYSGFSSAVIHFTGQTLPKQLIAARVRHWTTEGYRKIARKNSEMDPTTDVQPKHPRREFIEPLLLQKGWSVLDLANEAEVTHATAMDYLDGKTDPFTSTRRKLAKALGLPFEQLPT